MINQPMKLLAAAGVIAVLSASFLSHNVNTTVVAAPVVTTAPTQTAVRTPPSRSWYSGWFEGMEFNRTIATPPQRPAVNMAAVTPASGVGSVTISADRGGQYHASVDLEGLRIPMLVDTGATVVALRHEDALRLGLSPMPSDYTVKISTANGEISAARVRLREVRVENIRVSDVQAVVMPEGALGKSLLGMSFLKRLARFEVESGNLVLHP